LFIALKYFPNFAPQATACKVLLTRSVTLFIILIQDYKVR